MSASHSALSGPCEMRAGARGAQLLRGPSVGNRRMQRVCRVVRAQTEPVLRKPSAPKPSEKPEDATQPAEPAPAPVSEEGGVTIAFQREQAKALVKYFEDQKFQEIADKRFFGWTPENEIGNGRWVMFGILVGLITEYATGVDFIDQLKLIITYLGIADIYDY